MKILIAIVFGFTIIPVLSIALFVFLNWVIALLFNQPFDVINTSEIWWFEGILTVFIIVCYYTTNPFNVDWDK